MNAISITDTADRAGASPSMPAVSAETIPPFDYSQLEPDIANKLRQTALRVREHKSACLLEIGRELLQVKDQLEHGDWGKWLECECELKERTAQRMMNAAKWMGDKSVTVTDLPDTVLYMLSAPSTPPEIGDTILSRSTNGEHIRPGEVTEMLRVVRPVQSRGRRRAQGGSPSAGELAAPETNDLADDNSVRFKPEHHGGRVEEDQEAAVQELISLLIPLPFVDRLIELLQASGNPLAAPLMERRTNVAGAAANDAQGFTAEPRPSVKPVEGASLHEPAPVASPDATPVPSAEDNEQRAPQSDPGRKGAPVSCDLPSGKPPRTIVTAAEQKLDALIAPLPPSTMQPSSQPERGPASEPPPPRPEHDERPLPAPIGEGVDPEAPSTPPAAAPAETPSDDNAPEVPAVSPDVEEQPSASNPEPTQPGGDERPMIRQIEETDRKPAVLPGSPASIPETADNGGADEVTEPPGSVSETLPTADRRGSGP
jgi:hypothetical protein